jgi:ABC-type dipeptide/oligopeptide/nickel transport system permease component
MFWQILAWTAVILLYAFRVALVVGIVAAVYMIVRALRAADTPVRHAGVPGRR